MTFNKIAPIAALVAVAAFANAAQAGSYPAGCTTQPRSAWMNIDEAAATVTKSGYRIAKSKVSGSCYEVYARKNGER
ncbi:MAG: PepSY domain-containing protein, partial [Hyphomicrobiales bacterium]|nr:PepSY domain-containing protein [Hyphomicrobiales bacterium]